MEGSTATVVVAGFLDHFAMAVSEGPEAYFLRNTFDFGSADLASFFMTCAGSSIIWASAMPLITNYLPAKTTCVIFSFGSALVMMIMIWGREWWTPYLYAFFCGCTFTIVEVVHKTSLLCKMVPQQHQGAIYGLESALLNLGFCLGPLLGGALYQLTGTGFLTYSVSCGLFALTGVTYFLMGGVESRTSRDPFLRQVADPNESASRALEHLRSKVPLPNARCAPRLAADKVRQAVYFVDPDLYDQVLASQVKGCLKRSNSFGEESACKTREITKAMRASLESKSHTTDDCLKISHGDLCEPYV